MQEKDFQKEKINLLNFNIADKVNRFIFAIGIESYFSLIFSLFFGQSN